MTGGILLAHEVGKALDTRAIFTERENGKMTLKRGFEIPKGTRVLIVEDIVTTGGSVMEVLDVVKEHGGVPVGIGLLVDRSGGKVDFGIRTEALLHLDVPTFKEEDCPLCKEGKPFNKRGRTGKQLLEGDSLEDLAACLLRWMPPLVPWMLDLQNEVKEQADEYGSEGKALLAIVKANPDKYKIDYQSKDSPFL